MANRTNADSCHRLTVDTPPPLIPKGMQGSDSHVPLSPQWLLPKPGENNLGIVIGDSLFSPHPGNRPDAAKASGNGDDLHDTERRNDVFKPSIFDTESGHHDRWRDEERETNSAIRRDRWREGGRELGDTRRTERWTDNSSRHSGEARRAPSDRWTDSGNRENNLDQRRESKWNTRWGPDDKESENRSEKWSDSGKDSEGSRDKVPQLISHGKDINNHGKEDREGEHPRSWRSNSFLTRGRGEASHHQLLTPNKQAAIFPYGRGRGENGALVFPAGRGRVNSSTSTVNTGVSHSYSLGAVSDKSDSVHGDLSTIRYSRMKLLDIYRKSDIKSHRMLLEGFIEVSSLTLAEPLEPLALSAPTPEELVVLKGIDKGDIVSSGLPQVSKDGSVGRNSIDSLSRQTKLGTREDQSSFTVDYKDESTQNQYESDAKVASNQNLLSYRENRSNAEDLRLGGILKKPDEVGSRETSSLESLSSHCTIPWRSQSAGERSHGLSHSSQDISTEVRSKKSDMGWSHLHKEVENERKNSKAVSTSYNRDESQWQKSEELHSEFKMDPKIRRQSSGILDQQREGNVLHAQEDPYISRDTSRKFQPYSSPEDLSLYYKDPQGQIQGPFSGSDLVGWFEAGYFGIDLQVRVTSAPADFPFASLGDVMPHLRMKARPPPGFGVTKQNDAVELAGTGKFGGIGNINAASIGHTNRHEGATVTENRFLESLMSGNMSSSPSERFSFVEGMQAYGSSGSGGMPLGGGESGSDMNYLLAQKMSLDRHRSLPNPLSQWPGRDPASTGPKMDIIPQSLPPHSKLFPPVGDTSRQIPQNPQHVDLLSILQAAADKSPPPASTSVPLWSNFSEVPSLNNTFHGGMDIAKGKIDMHQNQHITPQIGFGVPQQMLQPQNQSSLSHNITQHGDLSGLIPPEMLLSSEISKDPQFVSLLQQQYLLSQLQLHSQSPLPTQLSLLDKILLLKQQQKQEQHQQLLLQQQQQQQHLLSQVLSGQQSHQHIGEPSYGHQKAAMPAGNDPQPHLGFHQLHEARQINQHMANLNLLDGRTSNISNVNLQGPQDISCKVSSAPLPLPLPHQIFDHTAYSKEWGGILPQDVRSIPNSDSIPTIVADPLFRSEALEKSADEVFVSQENVVGPGNCAAQHRPSANQTSVTMTPVASEAVGSLVFAEEGSGTSDLMSTIPEQVDDVKVCSESIPETCQIEPPSMKGVKDVEVQEMKKASDKKSRRQKTSKIQPVLDLGKGSSKQPKADFEIGGKSGVTKSDVQTAAQESLNVTQPVRVGSENSVITAAEPPESQQAPLLSSVVMSSSGVEIIEGIVEQGEDGTLATNSQTASSHRSWKAAPGLKAKSLIEIQYEEQRKAQTERVASETAAILNPTNTSPAPWAGIVNSEHKYGKDIVHGLASGKSVMGDSENPMNSKSRKSHLHDLLAEEVLAKSNEGDIPASDGKSLALPPLPHLGAQVDILAVDDDDFVEAKDTKKSRKKAAKAKGAGLKTSSPVGSADLSVPPFSIEKGKSARDILQENELLPVPPANPSLGDFVFWKGDQANSVPAPAWSSDSGSGKLQKPKSLRDIQREQERKTPSVQQQIPIPAPAKVQPNHGGHRSGSSSWQVPGSSPSKATSPILTKATSPNFTKAASIQTSSLTSTQSKSRIEDDLFWGPLQQSKQETKQSEFPSLGNSSSSGVKGTTGKGIPVATPNRQKPPSSRPADYAISSSPSTGFSLSKGRDAKSNLSEAMDFRDWCERELVRLTGTNDTSFLEFCLKQPSSEAEMLLRENLGSLDRNHEFIDKFLNYKEFLSSDVIDIAFRPQNSRKVSGDSLGNAINDAGSTRDADTDAGGGGKKKAKKGKKVNPAVLGFSVVSNRIMKGEIQSLEE